MTDYDAGALKDQYERLLPPRWKTVDCPTCLQPAGYPCGMVSRPGIRIVKTPHMARMRAAGFFAPQPCAVCHHAATSHRRSGGPCVSRICGCKGYELPDAVR
jgi:hypothetical protein